MNDAVIYSTVATIFALLISAGVSLWRHELTAALVFVAGAIIALGLWFNIAALRDIAYNNGGNAILSDQKYEWVYSALFLLAALLILAVGLIIRFSGRSAGSETQGTSTPPER